MIWLVSGILIWCLLHPIRSVAGSFRSSMIKTLGTEGYRGLFSLLILGSVVLMVIGWRGTVPTFIYLPPAWGRSAAIVLMLIAFLLFAAAGMETNIKRYLRHPQLTGAVLWAVGHLLANGDSRSLILFGSIGVWALIEMPLISRREGEWVKPDPVPLSTDIKVLIAGVIAYVVLLLAHPYLFGVAPIGG